MEYYNYDKSNNEGNLDAQVSAKLRITQVPKMTCIIHIGHGKTGTSSIQSYLAGAADHLKTLGILYPEHHSFDFAARGEISSGNGNLLLEETHIIEPNSLYSSEILFQTLATDNALENLLKKTNGDLKIVCYTRDLFDFSFSIWGQLIKRSGFTKGYDLFMKNNFTKGHFLEKLEYWIDASNRLGFELKILNYSRQKHQIIPHFLANSLEIDTEKLLNIYPVTDIRVNRSLTLSEYEFQRLMNKHVTSVTHGYVSDLLVNQLPHITAQRPFIRKSTYQLVVSKLTPMINRINMSLPPSEAIKIQTFNEVNSKSHHRNNQLYEFSREQLEVLAQGFAKRINNKSSGMTSHDSEKLRDIALKFDQKTHLDIGDAIFLMSLAKKGRPNGPLILQKLSEYESELAQPSKDAQPKNSVFTKITHSLKGFFR